jgi:hypothetical protein
MLNECLQKQNMYLFKCHFDVFAYDASNHNPGSCEDIWIPDCHHKHFRRLFSVFDNILDVNI